MPERFSCPADLLAEEIEFAITYTVACNQGFVSELLTGPPRGRRADFARAIAAMLLERAVANCCDGLSGMALREDDTPVTA